MLVKGADDQGLNRHKKVPNCLGQIMTGIQIIIAYILGIAQKKTFLTEFSHKSECTFYIH